MLIVLHHNLILYDKSFFFNMQKIRAVIMSVRFIGTWHLWQYFILTWFVKIRILVPHVFLVGLLPRPVTDAPRSKQY